MGDDAARHGRLRSRGAAGWGPEEAAQAGDATLAARIAAAYARLLSCMMDPGPPPAAAASQGLASQGGAEAPIGAGGAEPKQGLEISGMSGMSPAAVKGSGPRAMVVTLDAGQSPEGLLAASLAACRNAGI